MGVCGISLWSIRFVLMEYAFCDVTRHPPSTMYLVKTRPYSCSTNGTNSRGSLVPAYNYYSKESFPYCDSHTASHSPLKGPTRDVHSTNNPSFIIHEKKSRSPFLFLPNHRPTATGPHPNPRVKPI